MTLSTRARKVDEHFACLRELVDERLHARGMTPLVPEGRNLQIALSAIAEPNLVLLLCDRPLRRGSPCRNVM